MPVSILIFGCDPLLLATRKWVLRATGHRVWTVATPGEVADILFSETIAVLILCHTLSPEERRQSLALASLGQVSGRPRTKTIILTAGVSPESLPLRTEVVDAMEGPALLLEAIKRLVAADSPPGPLPNPC